MSNRQRFALMLCIQKIGGLTPSALQSSSPSIGDDEAGQPAAEIESSRRRSLEDDLRQKALLAIRREDS